VAALGNNVKRAAFLIRRFSVSFAFRLLGQVLRKKILLLLNGQFLKKSKARELM